MSMSTAERQALIDKLPEDIRDAINACPIEEGKPENRPTTWGHKSYLPYYNKKNAENIKHVLDGLFLEDSVNYNFDKEKKLFYADYGLKHSTLYLLLYQGWMWLIWNNDTEDKKYLKLRADTRIKSEKDGIRIAWRPSLVLGRDGLTGTDVEPLAKQVKRDNTWKPELEYYIENASEGEIFEKANINLSPEDFIFITASLTGTVGFHILDINPHMIKIQRKLGMIIEENTA